METYVRANTRQAALSRGCTYPLRKLRMQCSLSAVQTFHLDIRSNDQVPLHPPKCYSDQVGKRCIYACLSTAGRSRRCTTCKCRPPRHRTARHGKWCIVHPTARLQARTSPTCNARMSLRWFRYGQHAVCLCRMEAALCTARGLACQRSAHRYKGCSVWHQLPH